ncbi:MAG TPA: hypothetical protein VF074_15295 [Pyrinomonadaceae bacterium]
MYGKPMIHPLDASERIYALQDEKGNTIGTGTREVCEVLLHLITQAEGKRTGQTNAPGRSRPNVRAAIPI